MSTSSPEQRSVFRRKPVEAFVTETESDAEGGELSRSIGLFQLTMFEVGATIGTGIFIILTEAVPEADPSIIISFVLAGITAALTAVCYAELASTIWGHPSLARVDAEYAAFLTRHAEDTIAEAREFIGDAARAEYISTSARTATEGLVSTATRTEADLVVLGSARHGPFGRFAVGSVTNEMLHTAPVPVVLTPRGYSPSSDARLRRVTCAFAGSTRSRTAFDAAVQLSRRHGLPLRLTTLVVRDRQMYPSQVGYSAERLVADQWRAQAQEAQDRALATLPEDVPVEAGVVSGRNWEEALDSLPWEDGEVLVVGSSRLGPVRRVFLGSNSTKIVRSSPVPVVVIPRGADVHLDEDTPVARSTGSER